MNSLFGLSMAIFKKIPLDLNSKELIIYGNILILMFWLGFSWHTFIF
jgi:hypothetical protein